MHYIVNMLHSLKWTTVPHFPDMENWGQVENWGQANNTFLGFATDLG